MQCFLPTLCSNPPHFYRPKTHEFPADFSSGTCWSGSFGGWDGDAWLIFVDNSGGFGWCGVATQIFLGSFTPKIGEEHHPFSRSYFSNGLVQPPTSGWCGCSWKPGPSSRAALHGFVADLSIHRLLGFKDGIPTGRCWERNRICNRCLFYSFFVIGFKRQATSGYQVGVHSSHILILSRSLDISLLSKLKLPLKFDDIFYQTKNRKPVISHHKKLPKRSPVFVLTLYVLILQLIIRVFGGPCSMLLEAPEKKNGSRWPLSIWNFISWYPVNNPIPNLLQVCFF